MIKSDRHARLVALLRDCDVLTIPELARRLGQVSAVTVRRDVAELAARGLIRRSHGAALGNAAPGVSNEPSLPEPFAAVDALLLPPVEGREADTLRGMARRRRIPFLAESSEQEGGAYLGPDNFAVGRELGNRAARSITATLHVARILLVSHDRLPNTRARCDGFLKGFTEAFKGNVESWRIDGRGRFREAFRGSLDAFAVHPRINIAFGVNDHSVLAAIEAAGRVGNMSLLAFSVGGEGGGVFDALSDGRLKGCAALFPEVVGLLAVETLSRAMAGEEMPASVRTPSVILTAENLGDYYERRTDGWALRPQAEASLLPVPLTGQPSARRGVICFVPHYPAHDWYRNMAHAMRRHARLLGHELRVAAPQAGIAREIGELRRLIAQSVAARIAPGETVAVNAGEIGLALADCLKDARDLTLVTNSLDIMERLSGSPGVKVILTSGEFYPRFRCLVGPSLGALFETLRVDRVLLSVDGLSARFGLSASDERMALAARRFAEAGRETWVLADHSVLGFDASHRIVPLRAVTEVVTDSSSLPADRLALSAGGAALTIADEAPAPSDDDIASVEAAA